MKRGMGYILGTVTSIMLLIVLLISSVELVALNPGFYEREFLIYDRARAIGISSSDLTAVTQRLLGYVQGTEPDLKIKAEIDGKNQYVFNSTEREHMVDVKNLWLFFRTVRNIGIGVVLLLGLLVLAVMRRDTLKVFAKTFLIGLGVLGALLLAAGIWIAVDFTSFWNSFHYVFFTNKLWILDPTKDILIQMMPQQLFFNMVTNILTLFGTTVLILAGGCVFYLVRLAYKRRSLLKVGRGGQKNGREEYAQ